jgi:NADP-dependent 3-hydroxy acid dehydrogenase YdfG
MAHTFYVAGCKVVLASRRKEELERVRKDLMELHSVSLLFDFVLKFSQKLDFSFSQQPRTLRSFYP